MSPAVELSAKYSELVALRSEVGAPVDAVRTRLRALASRFPGALRELDALPLPELERRRDDVKRASEAGETSPWMERMDRYHRLLRGALVAKRWLAAYDSNHDLAEAFTREHAGTDAMAWSGSLDDVARPAGGRLSVVALRRVARERGEDESTVRDSLLGAV